MVIVYFFPIAPIAIVALLLILAIAGQIAAVLPVIEIIFWVLFAVYAGLSLWMSTASDVETVAKRISVIVLSCISSVLIGFLTHSFFQGLYASYGDGDLNGIIEFIFMILFGGCAWLLTIWGAAYAGFNMCDADEENYWKKLWKSVAIFAVLFIVCF